MNTIPHKHLTHDKRCHIFALHESGASQKKIATFVNVHPSTISRELRRNMTKEQQYTCVSAQKRAEDRRSRSSSRPCKISPDIMPKVEEFLTTMQFSPEQISGRLKITEHIFISHQSIYDHIWRDRKNGGFLYKHLRHGGKKRRSKTGNRACKSLIPNRNGIEERPKIVDLKERFGDIEADLVIGKNHKGILITLLDRKTKYLWVSKVSSKKADVVAAEIIRMLTPVKDSIQTITFDNGMEFASHGKIAKELDVDTYFAKPYASWQRGLNEHTNGLIRQYFPKKTDFVTLVSESVKYIAFLLNNRPRKVLNYMTPKEYLALILKH